MMIKNAKNILIMNLGGIGDLLLSTPALRALREFYPNAFISALVTQTGYEIAKGLSYLNDVRIFYMDPGGNMPFAKIPQNLRTLLSLRKKRFDIAVNMRTIVSKGSALKLKVLLDIINPRLKAGRDTDGMGYFFDVRIPETLIGKKYEMEYDIDAVRALGAEVIDRGIDYEIKNSAIERIDGILEKNGIHKHDLLVGIHPGGTISRRWPIKYFSAAIDGISGKITCKFVITGAANEVDLSYAIRDITKTRTTILTGEINIDELFALVKRCHLFISNDTSAMHIAAALKTPLIALCGPGDITRFNPCNISDKAAVLYKKTDCSPCSLITCDSLKCLKAISPEEVIETALNFLSKYGRTTDA